MPDSERVGGIYYEVASDTSKLLNNNKEAEKSLDSLADSMKKVDKASDTSKGKMTEVSKTVKDMGKESEESAKSIRLMAAALGGLAVVAGTAMALRAFVRNTKEAEAAQAQLAAVLKSTGESAGFNQQMLNDMSSTMAQLSTFSNVDLTQAQTILLGYTNIVGEQLPRALQAAMDMSIRTGDSIQDSARNIGRALEIPSKNMRSLSRDSVQFTDDQKKLARQLEETGRLAEAQGIVLDSLETSYGGAAKAARDTLDGALKRLKNTVSEMMTGGEGSLNGLTQAVNDLADMMSDPATISAVQTLATAIINSFAAASRAITGTVNVVKWAAEEVAARAHDPALGDTPRIEDALARAEKRLQGAIKLSQHNLSDADRAQATRGINEAIADVQKYKGMLEETQEIAKKPLPTPKVEAPRIAQPPAPRTGGGVSRSPSVDQSVAAAQRYIQALQQVADQVNRMTASERLQYDLAAGRIRLQGEQLTRATELAKIIDAQAEAEKQKVDSLNRTNAQLAAERQLRAELLGYSLQLESATMGSNARSRYEERARMEQDFADRVADIQARRRDSVARADRRELPRIKKLYDDQLKIELEYQERSLAAYDEFTKQKRNLDEDWRVGASRAINDYEENTRRMADQMESVVGNAIRGLEDAFVKFTETGKLSFSDLARSIISDMARIAARQASSGLAGFLGNIVGSVLGSIGSVSLGPRMAVTGGGSVGAGALNPGSMAGISIPGRASGGPVSAGKMYQVNERGHPELLNVGGQQYLMMGKRSGSVTAPGGGQPAGKAAGPSVVVNVVNNTNSQVSTGERQDNGVNIIDIVIDTVASDIRSGGRVAGAAQATWGLNRGMVAPRYGR